MSEEIGQYFAFLIAALLLPLEAAPVACSYYSCCLVRAPAAFASHAPKLPTLLLPRYHPKQAT
ncbi:uncharacterized protein ColSpa_06855 [Colletotrichum spaethianum]|uniref:Secreted protein n=1 Tax=Colletotrichum spaethianum TaxID=700344 RepID=A0AA37LFV2_9PEZI|nr:uncharacterized protein ColSpa_06855 [Colletotrichum spaethianum]GKT46674.1 hypothetical protein ColSpa_06855 [Colletotrichum spaethianum]